tara:strand:+ start:59 stop:337 length:279 start_codon:yes stop_codon:yes gene_type:complete
MILTIIILSILLCASIFANYNLLKKLENVEDDNDYMMDWINKLSSQTSHILKQIKEIDRKGLYESADDTGTIFKEIKNLISTLEKLVVKVNE